MKVLAISYGRHLFDRKNIERVRMEACAQQTDSLHIIVFTYRSDNFQTDFSGKKLAIHPTNSRSKFFMLWDVYQIGSKILKDRGQWVITSQDPFEPGLVGWLLSKKYNHPFNIQEHGDVFSSSHWRRESLLNNVRFYVGRWLLRQADTVRVVSKRMFRTMEALGIASERIKQLPVRTDIVDLVTKSATANFVNYDVNYDSEVVIISMARFVPQKNLSLLISAFARTHRRYPKSRLLLVGEGVCENGMQTQVRNLDLSSAVTFLPWTNDPKTLLNEADVYALSSNYEGWGRVLVEAMQAGLPIITTDVGCANEVVQNDKHGFVVPVGDLEKYDQRLFDLVSDVSLRKKFGSQGQNDASQQSETLSEYAKRWSLALKSTLETNMSGGETPSE
tara:strand:- start:2676 stop:3845 length:1170 start_codon:yes stop_codon:yes gene_type:complete